ncbi:Structural maintenance of chromosomes protein 1 [Pichia californica]|uniref:Structural maintenance of chromosomes protein n=1 Tax=Pichia californica TaxID=460514 RepID=A0A9P6WQ30_9ASCO|nr:Structural maintenance of chromosomes protein 1 [[Candida] californica]
MGRLVGLELYNFKSYKGKTLVGFGTSYFTSIIGPNGSGKSNMMDAISFVLGVRSNQLRSKNIKSLIYRGQINEEEGLNKEDKQEEELKNDDKYNSDDDDDDDDDDINSDVEMNMGIESSSDNNESNFSDPNSAYVIAIYEKDNKDILNLKREISPSGTSSFIVNGVQVTVSQYLKILKEENILIKAKNFLVFQGDVEKVASQSPLDLTNMIESISGSINLKKEFDDLKDEREKAHDITALKNSLKRNLKDEIKNLKVKCYEADQFEKKTKKLENLIITQYLSKLEYLERLENKFKNDSEEKNEKIDVLSTAVETKQEEYKDFIRTQSDEHMTIKEYETKIENDESSLKSIKTMLIPLESETSQLNEKIKDYEKRILQIETEKEEQQDSVDKTSDVLSTIKAAYDNFKRDNEEEYENENNNNLFSYSCNIELLTEYNILRGEFLTKAGDLEAKLNDIGDEKNSLLTEIDGLKLSENIIKNRITDLESSKTSFESKKSQIESQIKSNTSAIKNYERELNSLESLRQSIKDKEHDLNKELKHVLLRLNEINAVQRENAKERKLRETCATLKRLFPNVRGLLNDICKPKQKKYGIALAAILGKNFDAIIVDTISTATECIEYMKEQRLGVASFIPLDTVKIQSLDSNLRNLSENARPVIDTITYPAEFERAIQYVCGNSLLCDTIEVATSLRWSRNINNKMVTLDGALIHKSGLMTGGGTDTFNTKWDKSEVSLLTERKEELKYKISEAHSKIPDEMKDRIIGEEIERLEARLPEFEKQLASAERNLHDINEELKHETELHNENIEKIEVLSKNVEQIDDEIDKKQVNFKKIQKEIYKEFCEKYKFDGIEYYESNYSAKLIKAARENTKYVKEIQRLEAKLEFETERLEDYKTHIIKLKDDKNNFYESWLKLSKEREEVETKIDDIKSDLEVTKEDYNALKKKASSLLIKATNMESELSTLKNDLKVSKRELITIEEELDSVKLDKRSQLVNAKLENVKIPLLSGSLDDIPLEDGSKEQSEASQEWIEIMSEFEINFNKLDDEYRVFIEGEDEEEPISEEEKVEYSADVIESKFNEQIEKLQDEVRDMHPDIRAREHLETAQEKYKEIESEFTKARNEEKEIIAKFEKIREERHDKFMKAFNHVSDNIDEVYKELTKSRASPLGGSAYLTLEDEDEPYSFGVKYHIMPPLKRFRDMENLSGGEKTIGALALLFAVHSFHPSPFFVLDEVDAALDNSNVNKIANYISKHRGPNFQFIVISLKNNLFERSDSLVGIYRDQEINSSKILTLDLREYAEAA